MNDDHEREEEPPMPATGIAPAGGRSTSAPGPDTDRLPVGAKVEVRTRLDSHRWGRGFVVQAVRRDGYVLTRVSDGATMPVTFAFEDVRPERKRGTWWY